MSKRHAADASLTTEQAKTMTSPCAETTDTVTYDWHVPLTEAQRTELLEELVREADEDAEENQAASRPPLPASLGLARRRTIPSARRRAG
jgi:hypothetical protein